MPAAIPGLFATGVNDNGLPLAAGDSDSHWQLVAAPGATEAAPAVAVDDSGFPFPYWMANSNTSRWLSQHSNENVFASGTDELPGQYTYETSFDLTDFDPSSASITGRVAADDTVVAVMLNGQDIGFQSDGGSDFAAWRNISATTGFVSGVNTLDIVVTNNDGGPGNPSGFRAELSGSAKLIGAITLTASTEAPVAGQSITLTATVAAANSPSAIPSGTVAFTYGGALLGSAPIIEGVATLSTTLPAGVVELAANFAGGGDVGRQQGTLELNVGQGTEAPAAAPFNLFSTGVSDEGLPLAAGFIDPHYLITSTPTSTAIGLASATNSGSFPFPYWAADSSSSGWISPNANENSSISGVGEPAGLYTYETTFDLTDFDPFSAAITGRVAADDTVVAIRLNGQDVGYVPSGGSDFADFRPVSITRGFIAGVNTLEFIVENGAGDLLNPSGFRAELSGTAKPSGGLTITASTDTPVAGQPVTLTATVTSPDPTAATPSGGTVAFFIGGKFLGAAELAGGQAVLTISLPEGEGDLSASYLDDSSTGSLSLPVDPAEGEVPVPFDVYSTGVDDTGIPLTPGAADPHYSLSGGSSYATLGGYPFGGYWTANNDTSAWVSPHANENSMSGGGGVSEAAGDYTYQTTFDLTNYDPATARITGLVSADNRLVQVLINGVDSGYVPSEDGVSDFRSLRSLDITSGFVEGINTLTFVTRNYDDSTSNAAGLRTQLSGTAVRVSGGISGQVWRDADEDQQLDNGEGSLAGVAVDLVAADGQHVATQVTDMQGSYFFPTKDLVPGDYHLQFGVLPGFTRDPKGGSSAPDQDTGDTETFPVTDDTQVSYNSGMLKAGTVHVYWLQGTTPSGKKEDDGLYVNVVKNLQDGAYKDNDKVKWTGFPTGVTSGQALDKAGAGRAVAEAIAKDEAAAKKASPEDKFVMIAYSWGGQIAKHALRNSIFEPKLGIGADFGKRKDPSFTMNDVFFIDPVRADLGDEPMTSKELNPDFPQAGFPSPTDPAIVRGAIWGSIGKAWDWYQQVDKGKSLYVDIAGHTIGKSIHGVAVADPRFTNKQYTKDDFTNPDGAHSEIVQKKEIRDTIETEIDKLLAPPKLPE
ncbi:Ig-like domain repeat protein [Zavarzinella formosa]|uniref:Ig-like domain repeat protein n=1 Tax=Zavarzinella formosa TaxID=360055 RepID=UPI00035C4C22|nr:Ig-like domain repeat protein [Zavarzinella formosa]